MPTIEEVISSLKTSDADAAGVVQKLLEDKDNFKTQSRRWEDQAKTNMTDAEKFRNGESEAGDLQKQIDSLTTEKSELETKLTEKDSKLTEYEQKETRGKLVTKVAADAGIPAHLHRYLSGDTEEELETSAGEIKRDFKFGEVGDFGNDQKPPSNGTLEDGKALYEDYNKN